MHPHETHAWFRVLAIALLLRSRTFGDAIERCVNHLGDADSTAAICGQIAGALYGWCSIDVRWKSQLHRWDDAEVALRAALLTCQEPVGSRRRSHTSDSDSAAVAVAPPPLRRTSE